MTPERLEYLLNEVVLQGECADISRDELYEALRALAENARLKTELCTKCGAELTYHHHWGDGPEHDEHTHERCLTMQLAKVHIERNNAVVDAAAATSNASALASLLDERDAAGEVLKAENARLRALVCDYDQTMLHLRSGGKFDEPTYRFLKRRANVVLVYATDQALATEQPKEKPCLHANGALAQAFIDFGAALRNAHGFDPSKEQGK